MTDKKKKAQEPERNEYNDQSISALKGADRIRLGYVSKFNHIASYSIIYV